MHIYAFKIVKTIVEMIFAWFKSYYCFHNNNYYYFIYFVISWV